MFMSRHTRLLLDTEAGCADGSEREMPVVMNVMNKMKKARASGEKAMRATTSLRHKTIRLLTTC